jgi:hypothetical protein
MADVGFTLAFHPEMVPFCVQKRKVAFLPAPLARAKAAALLKTIPVGEEGEVPPVLVGIVKADPGDSSRAVDD